MGTSNTLRRELITAFAVVFAGALLVAVAGAVLLLPVVRTTGSAFLYLSLLLAADLLVFALFGRWLVQTRILSPLGRMVDEAEAIAAGDYERSIPAAGYEEIDRLAAAMNHMAERLIAHQSELARNIESLEETNRQLTTARDDLVRAEKMASLGQMAAGVAHEIGNPLAAIMGNIDLLKRRTDGTEGQLVEATSEQIKRIDRIVKGLVDYARAREAKVRPIDVNSVVRTAVDLVATQQRLADVDVSLSLASDVPAVSADPYQLEQVIVNLMLNAADATEGAPERRVVLETSSRVYSAPAHVPARRKDDPPGIDYSHRRRFNRTEPVPRLHPFETGTRIVEISVKDTGTGIAEDVIDRIFEPFMTTKEPGKGTGLGLAVSARLIDSMDGTIRARNTESGAEFSLLLPASDELAEGLAP